MARNLFGGTAADAAENESGGRLPNLKGRVYASQESPDLVTDLLDASGNPLKDGLLTDERGMIPAFQGPDGVEQLWVDFNSGRVMLTPNDVGKRLAGHLADPDPHGAKAYTSETLKDYVAKRGRNEMQTSTEVLLAVDVPAGTNDVIRMSRDGIAGTQLKSSGALNLKPFGDSTPLAVTADAVSDSKPVVSVNDGGATNLRMFKNGDIESAGKVTVGGDVAVSGSVLAGNIGTARVFSGTADPASQGVVLKPGDIWVQYGS
ncbi:hypothetical protein [Streptomyces sp. URMC 123]|uniref:hypothetical protein n=1 Tax=Streptomyces sp. URMC 123 TaxID=3423403 RepID=UPI003F1987EB